MPLIRFSFYSPPPPHKNLKKSSPRTTRRASTLLALSILIALAALLSFSATVAAQTAVVDYDTNDDGYIAVASLTQLNAIRNDRHWNATGHQWAAEAVLEWLKENQQVRGSAQPYVIARA